MHQHNVCIHDRGNKKKKIINKKKGREKKKRKRKGDKNNKKETEKKENNAVSRLAKNNSRYFAGYISDTGYGVLRWYWSACYPR